MENTKKQYVKPEMTVMEVKLEPILSGSGYSTDGDSYELGYFD